MTKHIHIHIITYDDYCSGERLRRLLRSIEQAESGEVVVKALAEPETIRMSDTGNDKLSFTIDGWNEHIVWQAEDKKTSLLRTARAAVAASRKWFALFYAVRQVGR